MKVRYIGESFGAVSLTSNNIYECLSVELLKSDDNSIVPVLRIVDDSGEDYLYSAISPGPLWAKEPKGRWEIIEDDESGTLSLVIPKQ